MHCENIKITLYKKFASCIYHKLNNTSAHLRSCQNMSKSRKWQQPLNIQAIYIHICWNIFRPMIFDLFSVTRNTHVRWWINKIIKTTVQFKAPLHVMSDLAVFGKRSRICGRRAERGFCLFYVYVLSRTYAFIGLNKCTSAARGELRHSHRPMACGGDASGLGKLVLRNPFIPSPL